METEYRIRLIYCSWLSICQSLKYLHYRHKNVLYLNFVYLFILIIRCCIVIEINGLSTCSFLSIAESISRIRFLSKLRSVENYRNGMKLDRLIRMCFSMLWTVETTLRKVLFAGGNTAETALRSAIFFFSLLVQIN